MRHPYRTLETRDGTVGYYDIGDGRPLLLLHASGTGAAALLRLADSLLPSHRLIVPDLHGYGRTTVARDGVLTRHDKVVDALCDHLGEAVDILGHSMGGALAARKAARDPESVGRLVLIEPVLFSAIDLTNADHAAARTHDVAVATELITAVAAGDPDRGLSAFFADWNDVPFAAMEPETQKRLRDMAPMIAREVETLGRWQVPHEWFRQIEHPTLVLTGGRAPGTAHAVMRGLAALLPDADARVVDGVGHMGPVIRPDLFAPPVATFLAD